MNLNVIPGFESLTPQQCFDMSAKHVLKNGKACVSEQGNCVYSGIGCAAALFLTPEARSRADEMANECGSDWLTLAGDSFVPKKNATLIRKIQTCHDLNKLEVPFVDFFRRDMRELAKKEGLDDSVLDQLPAVISP